MRILYCNEVELDTKPVDQEGQSEQPAQPEQTTRDAVSDDYNPEWYKTDGRIGKMWSSPDVRDDIVKSYYHLEKKHEPLVKQFNDYNSTLKELGIADMNALKEIYAEYSELRNPENPTNQLANYVNKWLDNPLYAQDVEKFFDDLNVRELQRLYPNMNAEQIQKQVEMEQRLSSFEAEKAQQKNEQNKEMFKDIFKSGSEKNRKLAESLGFNYTPEIEQACLKHVMDSDEKNGYFMSMTEAFNELYGDKLEAARVAKIESDILKRMENKPKVPASSGKTGGIEPKSLEGSRQGLWAKMGF